MKKTPKGWFGTQISGLQMPLRENLHRIDFADELEGREIIESFRGANNWLSNFYPCRIRYKNRPYASTEHAYQAQKSTNPLWEEAIRLALTPAMAKKKGDSVPLRPDWELIKDEIMLDVLRLKFKDPQLEKQLAETYTTYLIEGVVWHDNYWGVCLLEGCAKCENKKGQNKLGKLLMKVRKEILLEQLKEAVGLAKAQ